LVVGGLVRVGQRAGGAQVAHDPEHGGPPPVQESRRRGTLPDQRPGTTTGRQESRTSPPACQAGWLSRDNATAGTPTAPTNCRLHQHWTLNLPVRLREHAAGRGARLMQVVAE